MIPTRLLRNVAAACVAFGSMVAVSAAEAPHAQALGAVNPVRVDLAGHPANSGFLVYVEGNVALNADESEGTVAAGGNLSFDSTYNIAAHTPKDATFTAPGDAGPTYLYVGGGMAWNGSQVLRVLNGGFTKIANSSTYTALNKDQNGATVNYRVVKPGASYDSMPRIEGTTNQQTPASVSTPVPSSLIDVPGAFALYRQISTQLGGCPTNTLLTDPNGGASPIAQPYSPGARGRLTLTPGTTNVLQMSTADLANLSEITFTNQPSASTPLVVNVTGTSYSGNVPNLAGIGGSQAPYILWNFPQATSVVVTGGASIEGTIYAPNAALNWRPTQNIEGNVIAASFTHGPVATRNVSEPREVHDFPFATTVSCPASTPTGTLTLVKAVDNTGGGTGTPADWTLTATGPQTVSGQGNSAGVTHVTVDAGTYALDESGGLPNYAPGRWTCTGGDVVDGSVQVQANADVTCTITNTYQPPPPTTGTLTLVKHVDGGTAAPDEWTLTADGPEIVTGAGNSPDVTHVTVDTGDYDLSESGGPADYTAGSWACTGGALTGSTVSVAADAVVTCEITNTYTPPITPTGTLTLVKHVDNTGGGTAEPDEWNLTATSGPNEVSGPANSAQVTGIVVATGEYVLGETDGPDDYSAGAWSCTGGTVTGSTVTVDAGADVSCEITNTYQPPAGPTGTLTLVKHVDGGLGRPILWTLTADGPPTVTGRGNTAQVTGVMVPTGSYMLSESGGPRHYTAGDWSCTGGSLTASTVSVTPGADVRCEITNTFQPPAPPTGTLTLVKHVDNSGGGQATADQWTLHADGRLQTVSGPGNSPQVSDVIVTIGRYDLSESGGPADYSAGGWTCTGGSITGSTVTVTLHADVRCEIINTYAPPPSPPAGSLTLIKHVHGGSAEPREWTLTAAGPETVSGPADSESVTGVVVRTGDYTLSESGGPHGYTASRWTCSGGALVGARVSVAENALATCEITNSIEHVTPPPPTTSPSPSPPSHPGGSAGNGQGNGGAGGLAFTGANIGWILTVGLGVLALGGVLLAAIRRRPR